MSSGCNSEEKVPPRTITLERGPIRITVEPARSGGINTLLFREQAVLTADGSQAAFINGIALVSDTTSLDYAALKAPLSVVRQREHSLLMEGQPDQRGIRPRVRIILGPEQDIGFTYWFSNEGQSGLTSSVAEITTFPAGWELTFSPKQFSDPGEPPGSSPRDSIHQFPIGGTMLRDSIFASLAATPIVFRKGDIILEKYTAAKDYYRVLPGRSPLSLFPVPGAGLTRAILTGDQRTIGYGETTNLRTRWVLRAASGTGSGH